MQPTAFWAASLVSRICRWAKPTIMKWRSSCW